MMDERSAAFVLSTYVMSSTDTCLIPVQNKRRKRRRNFVVESLPKRHFPGSGSILVCVLIGLVQCTLGQSTYYNSCFDQIRRADDNADLFLSKEEYNKFLITVSGGAVLLHNETPPVLSNPYALRLQEETQQLNVRGVNVLSPKDEENEMVSFCKQIYSGLLSIFDINMDTKACKAAFRTSDSNPQDEVLSSDEYTFFVLNISKDVSLVGLDFDELPNTIKDAFNDMSNNGKISKSFGDDYLLEFCERTAIAAKIGEVVYASMPSEIPTNAPATKIPVVVNIPVPTKSPIAIRSPVSLPDTSPPPDVYTKCKTALIISDMNRNTFLESDEYGKFLTELSDESVAANDFKDLDMIFQDTFKNLVDTDTINLSGFRPGLTPTAEEYKNLIRICNETYDAITMYDLEKSPSGPTFSPVVGSSNSTQISETELKTCKKYMVLSDSNRNSVMDESEFISFLSRMTTSQDLSGFAFSELDEALQDVYKGNIAAGDDGIDIDGSKPGQQPTPAKENYFRKVCIDVHDAIDQLEDKVPSTKAPSALPAPSQAPVSTIVPISDEFFRVCKTAMLIADRNRDDMLEAEEYMRFLNRLTISEFSGVVFADLDEVLQNGFLNVAIDNQIDVYGSKPGTTPTDEESDHLRHVCESVQNAIEGYHGGNSTSPPRNNNECQAKLVAADTSNDDELNESEYVVFLRSFTGINFTSFDKLPYLLRDQYDWLRLGESTVNIVGLANDSIRLQGNEIRISWICERTSKASESVKETGNVTNLSDYCDAAIEIADNNTDGILDENEFYTLTSMFTLGKWEGHNFSTADKIFREKFDDLKSAELNLVDVKEAKSVGLCQILANTTDGVREKETLLHLCSTSLKLSDMDGNGRLNQTEYIPFIDNLVTAYNLTISSAGDFDGIKANQSGIDIGGLASSSSVEEFESIQRICMTTGFAFGIINNTEIETVVIYNSFLISNEAGLNASQLTHGSDERIGLDKAYASFVDYEVNASSEIKGRFLLLQSATLIESEIYQIVDSECPDGYKTEASCQTAFASFNLTTANDEDPSTDTISLLSNKTQAAIDRGTLQLMLSTVDSNSTLSILESSLPVQPEVESGDQLETIDVPDGEIENIGKNEDSNHVSLAAIVGAAVGASIVGAALFFLFVSRQKKSRSSKTTEKEVIEVDDIPSNPSFYANDNALEGGSCAPTMSHFSISADQNDHEQTRSLSANSSSVQNVTTEVSSCFKIDDESDSSVDLEADMDRDFVFRFESNDDTVESDHSATYNVAVGPLNIPSTDVETFSFPDDDFTRNNCDNSYVTKENVDAKIKAENIGSFDSDVVTNGEIGFQVEDSGYTFGRDQSTSYSVASFPSSNSVNVINASDYGTGSVEKDSNRTGFVVGNDSIDDDDESGSFDEVEVESDDDEIDEIQRSEIDETRSSMCQDNIIRVSSDVAADSNVVKDKFDDSYIIEEYEDASGEEIEISVHDDEESDEISEIDTCHVSTEETELSVEGGQDDNIDDDTHIGCDVSKNDKNFVMAAVLDNDAQSVNDEKLYSHFMIGVVKNEDSIHVCETDTHNIENTEIEMCDTKHMIQNDDTEDEDDDEEEVFEVVEETSESDTSELEEDEVVNEEITESEEEGSATDDDSTPIDDSQNSDVDEEEEEEGSSSDLEEADRVMRSYTKYRPIIEELIQQVMPDELDSIDTMMEQFIGNEKELVTTLRNMAGIEDSEGEDDDGSHTGSGSDDSEASDNEDKPNVATKVETDTSEEEDDSDDEEASEESDASDEVESEDEDESDVDEEVTEEQSENDSDEEDDEDGSEVSEEVDEEESESEETDDDDDDSSEYESD